MGKRDDPRLVRFVEALEALAAEHEGDSTTDSKTLDEIVKEAEERYWSTRGDPGTEAARLFEEARLRVTTRQEGRL